MKMMLTRPERLALLLHLMGDEATGMARQGLSGEALSELDQAIEDFQTYPPSQEEIDVVLGDFENYFHLALQSTDKHGAPSESSEGEDEGPKILQIAEESFDVELEPTRRFENPALTGDTVRDLNQMHPYQVAQALKNETPVAAALVIRKLANEHAAKTLEFLPELVRPHVFLELAKPAGRRAGDPRANSEQNTRTCFAGRGTRVRAGDHRADGQPDAFAPQSAAKTDAR